MKLLFTLFCLMLSIEMQCSDAAVFLDLTGSQGSLGQQAMNGFLLALQNASPDTAKQISLRIVNTESDLDLTKRLVQEISPNLSIAAGFTDNNSVLASGLFFEKNKVPFLVIGATDPKLSNDYIYLVAFGDNAQAQAAADYSKKTFGNKAAVIFDSTAEYTVSLKNYFERSFTNLNGQIVFSAGFSGGCSIKEIGEKIAALNDKPDFIFLSGLPGCIGSIIKSLRDAGVMLPLIGGDGLDTPELITEARNNVWYTTHAWLSSDNPDAQVLEFLKKYQKAYQSTPKHAFAALGYDGGNLLIQALSTLEGIDNIKNFSGVTGVISYSKESHVPQKPVWIMQIKEGKASLAEKWQPAL